MTFEAFAQSIGDNYSLLFYVLVGVLSFLESMPFFGVFIPGQILIMLGGFLARLNNLNIFTIIITAIIFAFLGEIVAFNIGKKYGFSLVNKYGKYVLITKENFSYIRQLMREHTAKSIMFGRFNSLTRALSPFTAGASDLKRDKFM